MGQTITFPKIPEKIYGDKQFNLNAKASSGLTVYYISSDIYNHLVYLHNLLVYYIYYLTLYYISYIYFIIKPL